MNDKTLEELRYYFNGYGSRHDETILKLIDQNKRYREAIGNIKRRIHLKHETALELSVGIADEIENLYKDLEESE